MAEWGVFTISKNWNDSQNIDTLEIVKLVDMGDNKLNKNSKRIVDDLMDSLKKKHR